MLDLRSLVLDFRALVLDSKALVLDSMAPLLDFLVLVSDPIGTSSIWWPGDHNFLFRPLSSSSVSPSWVSTKQIRASAGSNGWKRSSRGLPGDPWEKGLEGKSRDSLLLGLEQGLCWSCVFWLRTLLFEQGTK